VDGTLNVSLLKMRNLAHIICPILFICGRKFYGSFLWARTSKRSVLGMRTHAMWDPSAEAKFPELYPGIEISCPMFQMNW
jgi:hypothetical protein